MKNVRNEHKIKKKGKQISKEGGKIQTKKDSKQEQSKNKKPNLHTAQITTALYQHIGPCKGGGNK